MQIKEFLNSICEQIKYKPIREEISKEIENHIEDLKEKFIEEGNNEKISEEKAIKQMGNAEEIGKKLNKIHKPKLDWKLLVITIILLCFGFLVAFIKTSNTLTENSKDNYMMKYLFFAFVGLVTGTIIYFIDYKKICKYSNMIYLSATITIILALMTGCRTNGRCYLRLGTIFISVSIIAVPLYIISFAGFLNNINKESILQTKIFSNTNVNINLVKIILLSVISLILLTAIPSMVSAFVLGLTYLIIATVKIIDLKENKVKRILTLWGIPVVLGIMLLMYCIGGTYRINRIISSFNPESDPYGDGWLGINRKLIIESAQIYGEADDMSNALDLFDEGTNFAFISILAHYGWGSSLAIVIAVISLSIKLIINTAKIKDIYGKLLIIGISSMFIMQSIFNILMNLNLWIEADFNIPFISYGGASLIINMMSLALILSIYRRKDILIQDKKQEKIEMI